MENQTNIPAEGLDENLNGISDTGGPQKGKIFGRVADVMEAIQPVGKNSRNKDQNYNFRSVDEVYNMVQPLLAKYRVFSVPNVLEEKREERTTRKGTVLMTTLMLVKFRFYTDDGSWIDVITRGEGMDTSDKSSNKAMTAAHKYAMIILFAIPTEEHRDGDYETPGDGGIDPKDPMLTDSPENFTRVKTLLAKMPKEHPHTQIDPKTLNFKEGKALYAFLKLYLSVQEGIGQIAERDDVTPEEITGFELNLMGCKTRKDLEVLIDALPPPPKKPVKPAEQKQIDFIKQHIGLLKERSQDRVTAKLHGPDEPFTFTEAEGLVAKLRDLKNRSGDDGPPDYEEATRAVYDTENQK